MPDLQLESNEQILFTHQRHWISLLPVWLGAGGLVFAIILLSYFFGLVAPKLGFQVPLGGVGVVGLLLGGLAVLILLLGTWVWRQNQLILTNLHLIQTNQLGLFNRSLSQLSLARIQDVTYRKHGLLATLFNFGDIEVETAGEDENFVFRQVGTCESISAQIMQAHEALEKVPRTDGVS